MPLLSQPRFLAPFGGTGGDGRTDRGTTCFDIRTLSERAVSPCPGGEPLAQPLFTAALLKQCRCHGIHTAIDTAGSIPLSCCQEAVDQGDLLLLDIKALDPGDYKILTGRSNTTTLELLDYRESTGRPVWIRHVLVPGYTLYPEKLKDLARFLSHYTCIQKVELLPFHKMGEYKWEQMGLPYRLTDTPAPSAEQVAEAKEIFASFGLPL